MSSITKNAAVPHTGRQKYPKAPDLEMSRRIALGGGIFDRPSYEALMRHVHTYDIAVDVGGHVGSWSLPMSRSFRNVVTFEPEPTLRKYLNDNIRKARRNNILVVPRAVTNLSEEFYICTKTRNSGQAHLVTAEKAEPGDTPVPCTTLDNVLGGLTEQGRKIGVLKIDVEGMELEVLKSGVETIKTHMPPMLLEINSCCARYGIHPDDVLDFAVKLGYREVDRVNCDHILTAD